MTSHIAAGLLLCLGAAVLVPWPGLVGGDMEIGGGTECQRSCGSVEIPFPFGMGPDHCMLTRDFKITCEDVGNGVRKPFMMYTGPNDGDTNATYDLVEVLNICPEKAEAQVLHPIPYECYDDDANHTSSKEWSWDLRNTSYSLSSTSNKFIVVGCAAQAYIGDKSIGHKVSATDLSGCLSMCITGQTPSLKPCSGVGCCQTDIPTGLQYYGVGFEDIVDRKIYGQVGTCSIAVPMASSYLQYNLSSPEVTNNNLTEAFNTSLGYNGKAPVVLEWSIGRDDCNTARTKHGYACGSNSFCYNATSRRGGYTCECRPGFEGNPYLGDGCKDINECLQPDTYPCFGMCKNIVGSFVCQCPPDYTGDAYNLGGCSPDSFPRKARIALGISVALLVALLIAVVSTLCFHNKENKKRQMYYEQHGGRMLSRILETDGNCIAFKFYDRGDLVKATRGFHKANIVGEGAHGTVYKATLGTATVAVKRCKQIDKRRTEEFVQELVVLCRVSHPNVVRLLGCCLHFEAPMLVYEFVPNGTLSDLLYGRPRGRVVTLPTRLRIAAETAEALAHLHSPPHPTLHGDIKPQNILLGKGFIAKVSDFGCSTINDNVQVVPKGTLAYLDPQFLQEFQITDKTDVYSFGVVLIELLTGKNPQAKEWKNLTVMFQDSIANGTLGDLLDTDIVEEGSMELIYAAAKLVGLCIAAPGNARPTMGMVAEELRQFSDKMPESSDEAQVLLEVEDDRHSYTGTDGENTGFSNLPALSTELAR